MTVKILPGSVNMKQNTEAIRMIEILTLQYKKKRMNTSDYIQKVSENLSKLEIKPNIQ